MTTRGSDVERLRQLVDAGGYRLLISGALADDLRRELAAKLGVASTERDAVVDALVSATEFDNDALAQVLISMVGSGHRINIDGIGGGTAVTTKTAMLSKSDDDWADVDYFFAQVSVTDRLVDFKPTCGNILVGVGPAAIEMGLVEPAGDTTEVKIRAVNTGARISARIETPGGQVNYDGAAQIDGVPGRATPVALNFMEKTCA